MAPTDRTVPATIGQTAGLLLVVSGPSGSGKTTLVRELLGSGEFPLTYSVSATSRSPRPGEENGVHYWFLAREQFLEWVTAGAFLEHAEVHGNLYGTPYQAVADELARGRWVLLEIDVQGQRQVKQKIPEAVTFFIRTPSLEGYEERLRLRASESEASLQRRLADARSQLQAAVEYDFQIVNETIPQALRTLRTLLWGLRAMKGPNHAG